jgi:hypothetical protein
MKKICSTLFLVCSIFFLEAQTFTQVNTFAGTSAPGLVNGTLATAEFNGLYSLTCDFATNDLYVSDVLNNCVRKISGGMVSTIAGNGIQGDVDAQGANARFYGTAGICFSNGDIYVCDNGNNKIKKIDAGGNVTTVAGTTIGYLDGSVTVAKFRNPSDVKVASNGDIYVADYGNDCIRLISNGQVTTIAGVGGVTGDQIGAALSAKFDRPSSIVLDGLGNIYIADQVNNKIKVLNNGMVSLLAGSGVGGNVNGTGAGAQFNHPSYIVPDLYGNLMVSEWINNDIRRCTPAGVVTALAGSGAAGYVNGPVATAEFNSPYGICVDNAGTIYVGDKLNNVVRNLSKGDVGIAEVSSIEQLSIFPNPTSDNLTIKNSENDHLEEIQIISEDGKLVKDFKIQNSPAEIKIDVADLPTGIYFINAISENKKKYSGRFVKE